MKNALLLIPFVWWEALETDDEWCSGCNVVGMSPLLSKWSDECLAETELLFGDKWYKNSKNADGFRQIVGTLFNLWYNSSIRSASLSRNSRETIKI